MTYVSTETNPYDGNDRNGTPENKAVEDVVQEAIRQLSLRLRVCLPAKVVAVRGDQLVDLQPLLKKRYVGGRVVDMPVIPAALVSMPMGQSGWIGARVPLAIGDTGVALFCDRSLDVWADSSGLEPVDTQDNRTHDLTDCIFFPGLVAKSAQTKLGTDLVLQNGKATLKVEKAGRFAFTNGPNELVDLTCQLAQAVIDLAGLLGEQALVNTVVAGPQPFIATTVAVLQKQKASAQALLSKLQTLKG